jgi:hypothetical protein
LTEGIAGDVLELAGVAGLCGSVILHHSEAFENRVAVVEVLGRCIDGREGVDAGLAPPPEGHLRDPPDRAHLGRRQPVRQAGDVEGGREGHEAAEATAVARQ